MTLTLFPPSTRPARLLRGDSGPVSSGGPFRTFLALAGLPAVPSGEMLCLAVLAQSGAWTAWMDWPAASAVLLGLSGALVAWFLRKERPAAQTHLRNRVATRRAALVTLVLLVLTVGAVMMDWHAGGSGDQWAQSGSDARRDSEPAREAAGMLGGTYRGVILLTDVAPYPLHAPPIPAITQNLLTKRATNPLSIPFFGVYWMFRWPESEPPPGSYVGKQSPLTSVFRSVDRFPLSMEARQNFGTLIDLACCSRIQMAIRSADVFATLELVLTNTTLAGKPSLSLGRAVVTSAFEPQPNEHPGPRQAVLSFDVPTRPGFRQFDEATIRFNPAYATASAKVVIDQFIFVPRGW